MNTILITESQAMEALKNVEADFMPFRILNLSGQILVRKWISETAIKPHNEYAWFYNAENSANNSSFDESIIIEMVRTMTKSGKPEVLHIANSCFSWLINE